jgi:hypothetical protein
MFITFTQSQKLNKLNLFKVSKKLDKISILLTLDFFWLKHKIVKSLKSRNLRIYIQTVVARKGFNLCKITNFTSLKKESLKRKMT